MNILAPPKARLAVEVVHDLVCPWCYLGLRRLKRALLRRPDVQAELSYRPFLLNPDMPRGGVPRADYTLRRFGGSERAARMQAGIAEIGRAEGVEFHFERIRRTPSSVDAHRLVRLAARYADAGAAIEALFAAYFTEGRDIGELSELVAIAASVGIPGGVAQRYLAGNEDVERVHEDNLYAHRIGISGVPCFIIAERHAIAGAQEPEVIERLLDVAITQTSEAEDPPFNGLGGTSAG